MKDVEKVADDIYFIKQSARPGWFFGITIIIGNKNIGLVDTGFENTPSDYIFPFIQELGRKPEDIDYVVNTHRDGDHIWGNDAIKERCSPVIAIHELETEAVETYNLKVRDGDVCKLGDREFRVIHTPGHRPGSICLYDDENKVLITGDSVCGDRKDLIRMDKKIYIDSLKMLKELDIKTMVMSHPFQPFGKSVLFGNETIEMIQASINVAEAL